MVEGAPLLKNSPSEISHLFQHLMAKPLSSCVDFVSITLLFVISTLYGFLPGCDVSKSIRIKGWLALFFEGDHGKGLFGRAEFEQTADVMRASKGVCLPSINDTLEIREIFDGLEFEERTVTYTVANGEGKQSGELIVSNREDASRLT